MIPQLTITVAHFSSKQALHEGLAAVLGFPGYYGMNWDAFDECIRDAELSDMPQLLVIRGWDRLLERLPRDAKLLRESLESLRAERPEVEVRWETLESPPE